jgi:predicted GNAT family acetyltransferase
MTEIQYTYEPEADRIVAITDDGQKAGEITYEVEDDYWNANHTWVDPEYRGYNIARNLVNMLADTARAENARIFPTCSYAKHVMEKESSFADVLFKHETP